MQLNSLYIYIVKKTIPSFKVTPFFAAEYLRNGTTFRHSFNAIRIGTYIRPTQQCHFE